MLILLPPSRGQAEVRRGRPVDLDSLSFPELTAMRDEVLDRVAEVASDPDGAARLGVPKTLGDLVLRNRTLRDNPTTPAEKVYTGVLYDALDVASLDAAGKRRARSWVVVVSALWGAVRLGDRIPPYRVDMCARLPGLGHLPQAWQPSLGEVLPAAAKRGLVVDCRSSEYLTAWRPAADLAERTLMVRVVREKDGTRSVASHNAKWTRGLVARRIVADGLDPRRPEQLAEALSASFEVELLPPPGRGTPWRLTVVEPGP